MKDLRRRPDHTRLFGDPVGAEAGATDGVTILRPEDSTMTKATKNGIYTLDGGRYYIAEGDELPEGAVLDDELDEFLPDERAKGKAPENKAKGAAPENRAQD